MKLKGIKSILLLIVLSTTHYYAVCQSSTNVGIPLDRTIHALFDGLECCDKYDIQLRLNHINDSIILKQKDLIKLYKKNELLHIQSKDLLVKEVTDINVKINKEVKNKKNWRKATLMITVIAIIEGFLIFLK